MMFKTCKIFYKIFSMNEFNKIKDSSSERILFLKTYIQGIIFNKILNYSEFF